MDQKYIVIGLVAIVIIALFIMNKNTKNVDTPRVLEKMTSNSGNTKKVINYNASWCGWSKRLDPVWQEVIKNYSDSDVEIIDMKCNSSDENQQLCNNAGIRGYPTIKAYVNGDEITYKGQRDYNNIVSWINSTYGLN